MPRTKFYSLFRRERGTFKWVRIGIGSYPYAKARSIFRDDLDTPNLVFEFKLKEAHYAQS